MRAIACFAGGALLTAMTGAAVEFPLEMKTVSASAVWTLPGGGGAFAQLQTLKPAQIKNEPKAASAHPLYGSLNNSGGSGAEHSMLFRLDESKGDNKGYDTLILDLNANNDLTDDTVFVAGIKAEAAKTSPDNQESQHFGPIPAPKNKCAGLWQPVYHAQMTVYNRQAIARENAREYLGYLRLKSGCYLETTVKVDGHTEKLGFMDAGSDMRLGDRGRATTYRNSNEDNWYFIGGDVVLRDRDGSGEYNNDRFDTEAEPMSELLYVNAKPYSWSFAPDFKSVRLELFTGPLGELEIQPQGRQIQALILAREVEPNKWELMAPTFVEGKGRVPAGKYRFYSTLIAAKSADNQKVTAGGYKRTLQDTVEVRAGKSTTLKCGGPLELRVTANKQSATSGESGGGGIMGAARSLFGGGSATTGASEVRINMLAIGAGGETYSGYAKGNAMENPPSLPTFKIMTSDGKQVATGNLEFG